MMSLKQAAAQGIMRLRHHEWPGTKDFVEISIDADGTLKPTLLVHSESNLEMNLPNPYEAEITFKGKILEVWVPLELN